jgi:hypothetical protein
MKTTIYFFLISVVILFNTCITDDCNTTARTRSPKSVFLKMRSPSAFFFEDMDGGIDSSGTCVYNRVCLCINFNLEYITYSPCPAEMLGNIENISISSNNDYNQNYKSGISLNKIIKLTTYDFKNGQTKTQEMLNDFLAKNPTSVISIYFYFTEPPDSTRLHSLTIVYKEHDGTAYNLKTYPIYITQ